MKKRGFLRFILAMVIVAVAVMGVGAEKSGVKTAGSVYTVYAADTTQDSTEDAGTVSGDDVGDLDVTMGSDGKLTTTWDQANGDSSKTWNTIFKKYKVVITGFTGIATLTFLILFILQLVKLSAAANNPTERSKALQGILWIGIALAGSGSATLICALAWNALKD